MHNFFETNEPQKMAFKIVGIYITLKPTKLLAE